MGELSEQNRALVERVEPEYFGWQRAPDAILNRLLDAARTEGRGEGEPVAWQEAAEPFFRLAREVINPVHGERPWHADSKDWMVVFSFAGQSVTLGDLRRAAVASPIREPEISREALGEAIYLALYEHEGAVWAANESKGVWYDAADRLRAILNLAPVGGRGEEEPGSFSVTGENGWRPEVRAFADLMEAQLRDNDHKPGWKNDTDLDLFERLGEESAELLSAIHRHAKRVSWGDSWVMEDTVPRIGQEAADVANFAMMIADVCGALPPPPQEQGGMK